VVLNAAGEKLSKQTGARALDLSRPQGELRKALAHLGQPETDSLAEALRDWNPALIPAQRAVAPLP
jgi:glutamyl-Q tRNA(Asp) synthetase